MVYEEMMGPLVIIFG